MKDVLDILGNIPVTKETISSLYPDVAGSNQKVSSLEHSGKLLRLKRGLYIVNPEWSGKRVSNELVANHLYSPPMYPCIRHFDGMVSSRNACTWYKA